MDFRRIKDYSIREKFPVRVESLQYHRSIFIFKQKQFFSSRYLWFWVFFMNNIAYDELHFS